MQLVPDLRSAELFLGDEIQLVFDCALAYLLAQTEDRAISIQDVVDAVKSQFEDLLHGAVENTFRGL